MATKAHKSSRKSVENRLRDYPSSLWKHIKQIVNHNNRAAKGLEPKLVKE